MTTKKKRTREQLARERFRRWEAAKRCRYCGKQTENDGGCAECRKALSGETAGIHRCPVCGGRSRLRGECCRCREMRAGFEPDRRGRGSLDMSIEYRRRMGDGTATPGAEVRRNDQD